MVTFNIPSIHVYISSNPFTITRPIVNKFAPVIPCTFTTKISARFATDHSSILAMGAGVCALLLLLLVNGLVQCNDRRRRDVHRIIIREQVARGPGQHHHYHSRGPARGHSSDGRKRGLHDSHEYSDEFEVK